ncbi:protein-disulfide reductase DsbD domain-containing protein [Asticcacaulis sp. EMRT-3]|uniref:protein-disulfide reductase DsbD family protein n=1 Tax=Asticcacaulis sp. EMRT-3 TaxID=3040349 RepID=UPI0024AEBDFC|nr:protein-disulfide reductase DsbD domain-containing protein [Asticcacaulis sp. EMRT-3]MDI7775326.1 protein-disulfide reductase DsbD family protein [Asticcacaulis sp. EMRT-3]
MRIAAGFKVLLTFFALLLVSALPAQAADGQSAHIKARLIAASATVPQDGEVTIGLDYTAARGWHTYWINPGDTGLAPTFHWNLPDGVTVDAIQWPTPEKLPAFGLMSYGYEGQTTLLMHVHNASQLKSGDTLPLKAHIDFLVCSDVCVPESLDVALDLKVGAISPGPDAGALVDAQKRLPQTAAQPGRIALQNGTVELGFTDRYDPHFDDPRGAYFFPLQSGVVSAPDAQTPDVGGDGFALRVKAAGPDLPPGDLSGVLKFADGTAYTVSLQRGPLLPGMHGLGAPVATAPAASLTGVLLAMLAAFTGGLILNLMPCVFPVLSMKLLSLSRAHHDTRLARSEALVYGAGAVLSFVALAGILIGARALGASLGWGFQLQSPYVTAALSLIMLLVALNMSGLFEIGSSLQGLAGNLGGSLGGAGLNTQNRPRLSAFLTGVLAVVVAAPCTAPFMATAIGVALAQGGLVALAIFVALGVGFALPFVALTFLIAYVPGVAKALPRPGKWMDRLKHGLSVLMYLAALWLVWVFAQQVEIGGLVLLGLAMALVIIAVLRLHLPSWVRPVVLVAGIVLGLFAASLPRADKPDAVPTGLLAHQNFDVGTLAALRSQGKPVLVDLTAAWCVTCKVNERLVLSTPAFQKALKDTGTVYMVGDWTNQDAEISHYLSLYGRSGVPLYVYYGAHQAAPVVLPQILHTPDVVRVIEDGAT